MLYILPTFFSIGRKSLLGVSYYSAIQVEKTSEMAKCLISNEVYKHSGILSTFILLSSEVSIELDCITLRSKDLPSNFM
jgi:hypothetical protein